MWLVPGTPTRSFFEAERPSVPALAARTSRRFGRNCLLVRSAAFSNGWESRHRGKSKSTSRVELQRDFTTTAVGSISLAPSSRVAMLGGSSRRGRRHSRSLILSDCRKPCQSVFTRTSSWCESRLPAYRSSNSISTLNSRGSSTQRSPSEPIGRQAAPSARRLGKPPAETTSCGEPLAGGCPRLHSASGDRVGPDSLKLRSCPPPTRTWSTMRSPGNPSAWPRARISLCRGDDFADRSAVTFEVPQNRRHVGQRPGQLRFLVPLRGHDQEASVRTGRHRDRGPRIQRDLQGVGEERPREPRASALPAVLRFGREARHDVGRPAALVGRHAGPVAVRIRVDKPVWGLQAPVLRCRRSSRRRRLPAARGQQRCDGRDDPARCERGEVPPGKDPGRRDSRSCHRSAPQSLAS